MRSPVLEEEPAVAPITEDKVGDELNVSDVMFSGVWMCWSFIPAIDVHDGFAHLRLLFQLLVPRPLTINTRQFGGEGGAVEGD